MPIESVAIGSRVSVGLLRAIRRELAGIQRLFDAIDHLLECVRPRTETELRPGNLGRIDRTADRDLSDLGGLKNALDKLTAVSLARLGEQEAALQVNAAPGWKTDGKVHG